MSDEEKQVEALRQESMPLWFQAGELQYAIREAKRQLHKINLKLKKFDMKAQPLIKTINAKRQSKPDLTIVPDAPTTEPTKPTAPEAA